VIYMRGPGADRDLFVTANVTFDVVEPTRRVTPFLVAGGGLFRHWNRTGAFPFTSTEGALTGGGGARVRVNNRVFALGEFRLGWEAHYRVNGGIGVSF